MNENHIRDFEHHELLIELGFTLVEGGKYNHRELAEEFDFSAASKGGISMIIFLTGYKIGRENVQNEIKKTLGII